MIRSADSWGLDDAWGSDDSAALICRLTSGKLSGSEHDSSSTARSGLPAMIGAYYLLPELIDFSLKTL